jgi:hypothetical protein
MSVMLSFIFEIFNELSSLIDFMPKDFGLLTFGQEAIGWHKHVLYVIMLSVIFLYVIMLIVIAINIILLSVVVALKVH